MYVCIMYCQFHGSGQCEMKLDRARICFLCHPDSAFAVFKSTSASSFRIFFAKLLILALFCGLELMFQNPGNMVKFESAFRHFSISCTTLDIRWTAASMSQLSFL